MTQKVEFEWDSDAVPSMGVAVVIGVDGEGDEVVGVLDFGGADLCRLEGMLGGAYRLVKAQADEMFDNIPNREEDM